MSPTPIASGLPLSVSFRALTRGEDKIAAITLSLAYAEILGRPAGGLYADGIHARLTKDRKRILAKVREIKPAVFSGKPDAEIMSVFKRDHDFDRLRGVLQAQGRSGLRAEITKLEQVAVLLNVR